RPESMLNRSRTATASEGVPFHSGIQVDALEPIRSLPSSCAIPTSVLANDFVTEKTSCSLSGPVPLKYHSPASLPLRTATRQLDFPFFAVAAIWFSFAASRPTLAGATFVEDEPGTGGEPDDAACPSMPPSDRTAASETPNATTAPAAVRAARLDLRNTGNLFARGSPQRVATRLVLYSPAVRHIARRG